MQWGCKYVVGKYDLAAYSALIGGFGVVSFSLSGVFLPESIEMSVLSVWVLMVATGLWCEAPSPLRTLVLALLRHLHSCMHIYTAVCTVQVTFAVLDCARWTSVVFD